MKDEIKVNTLFMTLTSQVLIPSPLLSSPQPVQCCPALEAAGHRHQRWITSPQLCSSVEGWAQAGLDWGILEHLDGRRGDCDQQKTTLATARNREIGQARGRKMERNSTLPSFETSSSAMYGSCKIRYRGEIPTSSIALDLVWFWFWFWFWMDRDSGSGTSGTIWGKGQDIHGSEDFRGI